MKKFISILLILVVVLLVGGYLLAKEADAATPTDPLFKIDLMAEAIDRAFTFTDLEKTELEQAILDERAEELKTLLDENANEEILGEAVDNLDKQRIRTEERVQELEENGEGETEMENIRNRFETQLQNHLENMERVRERFEQKTFKSEEAQENFQKTIQNFENAQSNFQEAMEKMNERRDSESENENKNETSNENNNQSDNSKSNR